MKKRKILYLFPLAALILSGCTFEEGLAQAKGFFGDKVYEPIKGWVEQLLGKKSEEEEKKDDGKKEDQKPSGGDQGSVSKYGDEEHPLSVSKANELIAAENPTLEEVYVVGEVLTNEAWNTEYGQVTITLTDGTSNIKIFRATEFPEGFDKEGIKANSMKGQTVVAKGTGEIYNNTYELTTPTVLSVTGEGPEHHDVDNYGTAEKPLTVSEAIDVIKLQDPTEQPLFITGKVKSNGNWSSSYKNVDVVLTDGENDLTMFRCGKFPDGFDATAIKKDALKDYIVVGKGTGTYYVDGQKYELAQGCEVLSIEKENVPVSSVVLSEHKLALEVGGQAALTYEVLPENASNKEVNVEISQTAEVISYENGKVYAKAAGSATITVTSLADSTKSDSCTVTVTPATKELINVVLAGTPKTEYVEDESYSAEGLTLTAHYSDQSFEDVTASADWSFSKEKAEEGDTQITITGTYSGQSDHMDVTVTVSIVKGTAKHPYTVAEAREAATTTAVEKYVSGIIYKVDSFNSTYKSLTYWLSDNGTGNSVEKEGLQIYSGKGLEGADFAGLADLCAGDEVVVKGDLKIYQKSGQADTYEIDKNNVLISRVEPEASQVVVSGELLTKEYAVGDKYSTDGLVVTATLSNGVQANVTANATLALSKEEAEAGDTAITVTATFRGVSSEPYEVAVTIASGAVPGSADLPYTVAEARAAASTTAVEKYVSGIIYKVDSFNSTYKSLTYWISDDGTGDSTNKDGIQVYSGKGLEGADFAGLTDLSVGDEVVVKGDLKIYQKSGQSDTYEIDKNNILISRNVPSVTSVAVSGTASQTEYAAGANYNHNGLVATATLSNGVQVDVSQSATWTISPETAKVGDEEITVTATYGNVSSEGFKVPVTVTQPTGETYYDATMTKGTQAYDDGTVNGKSCIKIGNSSKGGDMTITVPANAVELKVYAVAWKGVNDLSLDISANKEGVTTDPASLALTADDGATGSSPFTIADETPYLFTIALSGVTEETVLTLATSAAKRCLVWGAQYTLA